MNKYFDIFKTNFPFISREDKTINDILNNPSNIFIEKKDSNDELIDMIYITDKNNIKIEFKNDII